MSMIYQSLVEHDAKHVWRPFTQAFTAPDPIAIRSASGANVVTEDGHVLLDLISSWWVNLHGHSHPAIAGAIAQQAHTLEHVIFAGFTHEPAVRLAAQLSAIMPPSLTRVFFSDNGSTAVEVALKMAFQYMANIGEAQRTRFIAFQGGYHGDTVGAMSIGASSGFFKAWGNMLFPVDVMPVATFDTSLSSTDLSSREEHALAHLENHLEQWGEATAAAVIEPLVQGAGGMRMHRPVFLQAVVERLHRHGILVVFDEVMTGFGRTGDLFACRTAQITPDFICLSKGITGGFLPFAATVTTQDIYEAFLDPSIDRAFLHGHSFTANPLGCAAALASLELLQHPECTTARRQIEQHHQTVLADMLTRHIPARVHRLRITGTIAAFDLVCNDEGYRSALAPALKDIFFKRGLLLRPLGNTLYLMPPYCISTEDLDRTTRIIDDVLSNLESS